MPNHKFAENPGNPINTFILPFVFTDKVFDAVRSLWKCFNPAEHRLVLIDNSNEEFWNREWLEQNSHLYIRSYRNLGPAVAFNLGIEMARTEYVTIFSDDARFINKLGFDQAVKAIDIGGSSNLIVSLGSIYEQKVDEGEFYNFSKIYSEEDYISLDRKYGMNHLGFSLACAIAKKDTWTKSGLFDETKYIYTIDGTFAKQAGEKGIEMVYNGVVYHYGDQSHKGRLVETGKYQDTGTWKDNLVNL